LRARPRAAHHLASAEPDVPVRWRLRENAVETVVGIALIVIAALLIAFLIRVVQSNMGRS
jgi:uncharacterized membrane protein